MDMKLGVAALAGLLALSAGVAQASPAYMGTWTLNTAESKYPPGFPDIQGHHMNVTKDDGAALQYTDNFIIGGQPETHVTFDGAYDGKPYKMTDGQMMAVVHTKTGYSDSWTAPAGTSGKDVCDFNGGMTRMTCHGEFTPPGAKQPVTFLEIWDKTK